MRPQNGAPLVLDAGTGIRPLGLALAAEGVGELDLLLTHMHLDHVEGLAFFAPLFDPQCEIHVWGPRPDGGSLESWVATWLSPPFFPVPFDRLPARLTFTEILEDTWTIGDVQVRSARVCHPGPTVAYRLSQNGAAFAFIPDNEPGLEPGSGLEIAGDAAVLFHDSQYTDEEYATRVGFGHSALSHFAALVGEAAPGRAVMFHHDPGHADDQLERMLEDVRGMLATDVELGREGLEVSLHALPR